MTQATLTATIREQPNAYAPAAGLTLGPGVAILRGYQRFAVTREGVMPAWEDAGLRKKQALLAPHWGPRLLNGRQVLDLGANNGFFAWWALQAGALGATTVDMDERVTGLVERARRHVAEDRLRVVRGGVDTWTEPADVVLALALVHWLYSCTASFGSLEAVVGWLAGLTRYAAVIEWIAPRDRAIVEFGHLSAGKAGGYTYDAFRTALARHFPRVTDLGFVTPKRRLFLAYRTANEIDLSGPLALLHDVGTVRSSRWLTRCAGLEFWSRVYDLGDSVLKQTTHDLAAREAVFLRLLEGPHFPRVLDSRKGEGWSAVRVEKVRGVGIAEARERLVGERAALRRFAEGCLTILEEMGRRGIRHRDISAENILVRDGLPVLLDFGWAVSDTMPYWTPKPLDELEHESDVLAMGRVLAAVGGGADAALTRLAEAMTHVDPEERVMEIPRLRAMLTEQEGSAT